jgi:hypothetical protein
MVAANDSGRPPTRITRAVRWSGARVGWTSGMSLRVGRLIRCAAPDDARAEQSARGRRGAPLGGGFDRWVERGPGADDALGRCGYGVETFSPCGKRWRRTSDEGSRRLVCSFVIGSGGCSAIRTPTPHPPLQVRPPSSVRGEGPRRCLGRPPRRARLRRPQH